MTGNGADAAMRAIATQEVAAMDLQTPYIVSLSDAQLAARRVRVQLELDAIDQEQERRGRNEQSAAACAKAQALRERHPSRGSIDPSDPIPFA